MKPTITHYKAFFLSLAITLSAPGAQAESISEFLDAFYQNPKKEMERLPSIVDENGKVMPRGYVNQKSVEKTLEEKNLIRSQIIINSVENASGAPSFDIRDSLEGKDEPERLLDAGVLHTANLQDMENRGLSNVNLDPSPWSDSYWPTHKGVAGNRYADPGFPKSKTWQTNYFYIQTHPASAIARTGNTMLIDRLSPAEKYDLAVGDDTFSLTEWVWRKGRITFEEKGKVDSWLGFCHGWAGASHMLVHVPNQPIIVTSPKNIPVTFYPHDIKALHALLWANASPKTKFVGNRCHTPNPPKTRFGRVIDRACFDTNPATWHLSLVNQMGLNRRSFVMDSTFDYQVWNFPLSGYRYRYFNPLTRQDVAKLSLAAIPIQKYKSDPFREFRSPRAKYVVGVYMDVTHLDAVSPSRKLVIDNAYKTIRLVYDLELDEAMNIVGGEWFSNAHPDFIWTFEPGAQALTTEDATHMPEGWLSRFTVPNTWSGSAARASSRGEPLASFILGLKPQ